MAGDPGLGSAVVRAVHGRTELGRAARRRRHRRDAGQHRAHPDRAAGRLAAQGGFPPFGTGRGGRLVRGRGGNRDLHLRRRQVLGHRRRAVPGRGRRLRAGSRLPEAGAQACLGCSGNHIRLLRRHRRLPAVRWTAHLSTGQRACQRDALRRVPRHLPHHTRLHDLGICPGAHDLGEDGRDHLRCARPRGPHVVGHSQPGTRLAHHRRGIALPLRSRRIPVEGRFLSGECGVYPS
jgi:hypothetical protein